MAPKKLSGRCTRLLAFSLLLAGCCACPLLSHADDPQAAASEGKPVPPEATTTPEVNMAQLVGRAWKITAAPSHPPAGSIYVFLQNGTLIETSCVETYRIATWTIDEKAPHVLHIVEDHRLAFTANVLQLSPSTMRLQQRFARTHERREITLTAVTDEYVCPDLPR